MIELPACAYAVPLTVSDIADMTADKGALLAWMQSNLEGAYYMVASTKPMSFGVPSSRDGLKWGQIDNHLGSVFMFEVYNDALLFQLRFVNGT